MKVRFAARQGAHNAPSGARKYSRGARDKLKQTLSIASRPLGAREAVPCSPDKRAASYNMASPNPTSESASFFERVRAVVAQIPSGRVTTYGDIAEHLGRRGAARMVGWALHDAVGSGLPCHRVVNRKGVLTGKRHFATPHVMEERLRSEGVTFVEEGRVDLDQHHWTPDSG